MKTRHFIWVRTEDEARELLDLGWRIEKQLLTRHHFYACLAEYFGEGEPVLPARHVTPP